jgi:hypothetical protein
MSPVYRSPSAAQILPLHLSKIKTPAGIARQQNSASPDPRRSACCAERRQRLRSNRDSRTPQKEAPLPAPLSAQRTLRLSRPAQYASRIARWWR